MYHIAVITIPYYSCKTWTIYSHHVKHLSQLHMLCLCALAGVKWQDKVPSSETLKHCQIFSTGAMERHAQLCWFERIRPAVNYPKPFSVHQEFVVFKKRESHLNSPQRMMKITTFIAFYMLGLPSLQTRQKGLEISFSYTKLFTLSKEQVRIAEV